MKKTRIIIATACLVLAIGGTAATKHKNAFTTYYYFSGVNCIADTTPPTDCTTEPGADCTDDNIPGNPALFLTQHSSTSCINPLYFN